VILLFNCIALSSGHGINNNNCGAVGLLNESIENRKIVKILKCMLQTVGIDVIECTSDYGDPSTLLKNCVDNHNIIKNALNIQIHYNAGGGDGVETLVYSDDNTNDRNIMADNICTNISVFTGFKKRGVKIRPDLYFLRKTKNPAIIIEICFTDSEIDFRKHDVLTECYAIAKTIYDSGMVNIK